VVAFESSHFDPWSSSIEPFDWVLSSHRSCEKGSYRERGMLVMGLFLTANCLSVGMLSSERLVL